MGIWYDITKPTTHTSHPGRLDKSILASFEVVSQFGVGSDILCFTNEFFPRWFFPLVQLDIITVGFVFWFWFWFF